MKPLNLLKAIRGSIHLDTNSDLANTILLAGVARGGTTWISNIINNKNEYRYLFEPFYSKHVKKLKGLNYRPYIPENEMNPEMSSKFEHILTGRIWNPWVDRFNKKIVCEKRLVKGVRANLLLKWLKNQFSDLRIILLLRHPFAVAHSRRRLGWPTNLMVYLNQPRLINDLLLPFVDKIKEVNDKYMSNDFEAHVCGWCIENYVPLSQFKGGSDIYLAFFESFAKDPLKETRSLFNWLKQDTETISDIHFNRPSEMAKQEGGSLSTKYMNASWSDYFSIEQLERGSELLEIFKLNRIYDREQTPKYSSSSPKDLLLSDQW